MMKQIAPLIFAVVPINSYVTPSPRDLSTITFQSELKAPIRYRSVSVIQSPHLHLVAHWTHIDEPASYQVQIEYGAKMRLKAFWTAQELLTTFSGDAALQAITLKASKERNRFLVSCHTENHTTLLWDRQQQIGQSEYLRGFPEMKELKQILRDVINPERSLGHSDRDGTGIKAVAAPEQVLDLTSGEAVPTVIKPADSIPSIYRSEQPNLAILYCTGCRWLLRAAYLAQEMLASFDTIGSISLLPARPPVKGGAFVVALDGKMLWDRTDMGRFPEPKEIEQLIRETMESNDDSMDHGDAEEARRYFGVL